MELEEGSQAEYSGPEGGYGSVKSVSGIVMREHIPLRASRALAVQNKPQGFMCVNRQILVDYTHACTRVPPNPTKEPHRR